MYRSGVRRGDICTHTGSTYHNQVHCTEQRLRTSSAWYSCRYGTDRKVYFSGFCSEEILSGGRGNPMRPLDRFPLSASPACRPAERKVLLLEDMPTRGDEAVLPVGERDGVSMQVPTSYTSCQQFCLVVMCELLMRFSSWARRRCTRRSR